MNKLPNSKMVPGIELMTSQRGVYLKIQKNPSFRHILDFNCSGGSRGAESSYMYHPVSIQFLSFSSSFEQNSCEITGFGSPLSLWGNPESATVLFSPIQLFISLYSQTLVEIISFLRYVYLQYNYKIKCVKNIEVYLWSIQCSMLVSWL